MTTCVKSGKHEARGLSWRMSKSAQLEDLLHKASVYSQFLEDQVSKGDLSSSSLYPVPALLQGTLRPYQVVGFNWIAQLWENGLNGILADEMGLGKTIQTIAFLAHLWANVQETGVIGTYLIVAPLSTLSNWVNEFKKWTPAIPVVMYHGTKADREAIQRKWPPPKPEGPKGKGRPPKKGAKKAAAQPTTQYPVMVTSYEVAINDKSYLNKFKWKYLVVDEAHRLKNFDCKLFQHLKKYSSDNRLLLTGTPLQNDLGELWSLLHFILPDVFASLKDFKSWFDLDGIFGDKPTPKKPGRRGRTPSKTKKPVKKDETLENEDEEMTIKSENDMDEDVKKEAGDDVMDIDANEIVITHIDAKIKDEFVARQVVNTLKLEVEGLPEGKKELVLTEILLDVKQEAHITMSEITIETQTPSKKVKRQEEESEPEANETKTENGQTEEDPKAEAEGIIGKLHKILHPFMLRRLKSELAECKIPKKCEVVLYCPFQDSQRAFYDLIYQRDIQRWKADKTKTSIKLTNILMELRKTCNHPFLLDDAFDAFSVRFEAGKKVGKTEQDVLDEELIQIGKKEAEEAEKKGIKARGKETSLRQQKRVSYSEVDGDSLSEKKFLKLISKEVSQQPDEPVVDKPEEPKVKKAKSAFMFFVSDYRKKVDLEDSDDEERKEFKKQFLHKPKKQKKDKKVDSSDDGSSEEEDSTPSEEDDSFEEGPTTIGAFMREAAAAWKALDNEERKEYQIKAKEDKDRFMEENFHERTKSNSSVIIHDSKDYVNQLVHNSGKLQLLHQMLKRLKANGHKVTYQPPVPEEQRVELHAGTLLGSSPVEVLIFSQMTRMLDILEDFIEIEGYDYCRIDGTTKQTDRQEQIALYNSDENCFVFLLSTRAGGLGINLTSADTVIIFDSDWNPQVDLQAQDRCHRIGQTRPVCVFRLVMANSVEGKILNVANKKLKMERLVIQHGRKSSNKLNKVSQSELASILELDAVANGRMGSEDKPITEEQLDLLMNRAKVMEMFTKDEEAKKITSPQKKKKEETEKRPLKRRKLEEADEEDMKEDEQHHKGFEFVMEKEAEF